MTPLISIVNDRGLRLGCRNRDLEVAGLNLVKGEFLMLSEYWCQRPGTEQAVMSVLNL